MADLDPFPIQTPAGTVTVKVEVFLDSGRKVCGIRGLDGEIGLPPKAMVKAVRAEVEKIKRLAKEAGCEAMRIGGMGGRDWSRVFPDFTPVEGFPLVLEMRL